MVCGIFGASGVGPHFVILKGMHIIWSFLGAILHLRPPYLALAFIWFMTRE